MSRSLVIAFLILALLAGSPAAGAEETMVLIANTDSPIKNISSLDLRKLYLGFVVTTDGGTPIRPLLYASDKRLKEIFLQSVMAMSERSYDHRLLTLTLQSGRLRPQVYNDLSELFERVKTDLLAVAVVWAADIEEHDNVQILRVLWHP